MRESKILQQIRDQYNTGGVRLWRNNVGTGLQISHKNSAIAQATISACIALAESRGCHAQRLAYGLGKGSGDLIGYRRVGEIAQFISLEVKTDTGRVRPEQTAWLNHLNSAGALAAVVRSVDDARKALDNGLSHASQSAPHTDGSHK
jgi:hypothetical protein